MKVQVYVIHKFKINQVNSIEMVLQDIKWQRAKEAMLARADHTFVDLEFSVANEEAHTSAGLDYCLVSHSCGGFDSSMQSRSAEMGSSRWVRFLTATTAAPIMKASQGILTTEEGEG
ncbi:hypothetical protein PIB30_073780 [Stylosanthes scabra]|uniref:Uncharacterized protein n=1 Tax=Stylosanthes scabra TaxID=79078 RepID=A0ABU6XS12_9FABA|nr:hypothetical protein [Stylosanthes scabra]